MIIKKITQFLSVMGLVVVPILPSYALELLSNDDLSGITGQASLFTTDYIPPGGSNPNTNIGFYRLGVDAELSLNANIRGFRLGCDGPNGTGVCDINFGNVRLTGLNSSSVSDSGPTTDAVITRPFFEFAIRNPTTAATRELVGIRFGAQQALGRLSVGENPDPTEPADDTGIVSFSGDMNAQIFNARITNICARVVVCLPATAQLEDYDYAAVHGGTPLIFSRSQVNGCGSTDFPSAVNCMFFDGLVARASLFGLVLDSRLTEDLRFIHDLGLEDGNGNAISDLSMSLQKEAVRWQKISTGTFTGVVPAQKGWWLSVPNVVVRNLSIDEPIEVNGLGALTGQPVVLQNVDLGQRPVDNCYGSLTFC